MENKYKEWKSLEEIEKENKKTLEFPIECLPKELREYAEAVATELQVPISIVATGLIAVVGLCNQGKYKVEGKENWLEPLNIYAII